MTNQFSRDVGAKLETNAINQSQSNDFLNDSLVNALRDSAAIFPTVHKETHLPVWKSDQKLKDLFATKTELVNRNADPTAIKRIRKKIRSR